MFVKKLLVSAMIAAGMLGCVAIPQPGVAESSGDVYLDYAPPPPRYEAVPPPRSGYVWSPGYWGWDGYRRTHVWVNGHWEPARAGYAYSAPAWRERSGRWYYQGPNWEREDVGGRRDRAPSYGSSSPRNDIDRDGIPNDRDPTPGRQRPDRD
jgi:WXXGXW repeat (2 copies)